MPGPLQGRGRQEKPPGRPGSLHPQALGAEGEPGACPRRPGAPTSYVTVHREGFERPAAVRVDGVVPRGLPADPVSVARLLVKGWKRETGRRDGQEMGTQDRIEPWGPSCPALLRSHLWQVSPLYPVRSQMHMKSSQDWTQRPSCSHRLGVHLGAQRVWVPAPPAPPAPVPSAQAVTCP